MKFIAVAALASMANALSVDLTKRDSPLDVKIELNGNTAVKALITNTGADDLKVLKTGTFLEDLPTEKAEVFQGTTKIAFDGIKVRVNTVNIPDDAFKVIAAGETIEASFDIAELHDLTAGGDFDVVTAGTLSYAEVDSNELAGVVSYSSNTLSASIDGAEAAKVRRAVLEKRSVVQSDCTGSRRTSTVNALSNCRSLAAAAASAAGTNTAKVQEYFKSTSSSTISAVRSAFNRAATECGSSTSGVSRTYCTDIYPACSSNVLAYTLPSGNYIVNCPLYFSALPALTGTCHAQDQATTTLHEAMHLNQIQGADDLGYGYAAATRLTTAQALNNADSFALFANAIYVGC